MAEGSTERCASLELVPLEPPGGREQLPAVPAGQGSTLVLPTLVVKAGERAGKRFVEFFTANIRNQNTRRAYARAVAAFLRWCEDQRLSPHSFRVSAITDLLTQGVPLEDVQYLAGHAEPRTTGLYDRRQKKVTRNIVERISI